MKTIVLGYHNVGCRGLESLLRHGFDVVAVFTHRDSPHETIWFDSVAEQASRHGIPVFAPDNINHPLWQQRIREFKPDILFSFYYRDLVGTDILEIPPAGCLNLHGSFLPAYRGRSPVNWVLVRGESETGATLHYMTPRPDDGDIVSQQAVPISDDDTAVTLMAKIVDAAEAVLDEALPLLKAGSAPRRPQDPERASYFGGRRPKDGEIDWSASAREVRNLVRAVTRPYPGAFGFVGDRKCFVWEATVDTREEDVPPGTVLSSSPLRIACGEDALEIRSGQPENGVFLSGQQLASELNLHPGMRFGDPPSRLAEARRTRHVLILGVNGFIGSALSQRLLDSGRFVVHGMDLHCNYIEHLLDREGFNFHEGDIAIHREWIQYHVRKCDIVVPLVAIATPVEYTRNPLRVFELDFEENLRIVRYCATYGKRLIFPSTSEVYGLCTDPEFDEDRSNLVTGPIHKQRWIYASIKQLLDRVIWAYGDQRGLRFTLFRPFNWIGPRLDTLTSARIGSSRAITQLILNLAEGTPIQLIDGGDQRRCFTDVSDGIECLFRIIDDQEGRCNGQIINIGNPDNDASIRELGERLVSLFETHPLRNRFPPFAGFQETPSDSYYGKGYQDVQFRRPSIRKARRILGWEPTVRLEESVQATLDFFLHQAVDSGEFAS